MRWARRPLACVIPVLTTLAWFGACAPHVPAHTPPPAVGGEADAVAERIDLRISDLHETASGDRTTIQLTGTLYNGGTRSTREVFVHVEALRVDGVLVDTGSAVLSTQVIAPNAEATFSASFDDRPEIDHYRVEAVAR